MTPEPAPKIWREIGDWFVHIDDPKQRHRIESFGADPQTNRVLLRLVCAVRRKEALTTCYADLTMPSTPPPLTDAQEAALCLIVKALDPKATCIIRDKYGKTTKRYLCRICNALIWHENRPEWSITPNFGGFTAVAFAARRETLEARAYVAVREHLATHASGDLAVPVAVLASEDGLPVAMDWLIGHGWPVPTSAVLSVKQAVASLRRAVATHARADRGAGQRRRVHAQRRASRRSVVAEIDGWVGRFVTIAVDLGRRWV